MPTPALPSPASMDAFNLEGALFLAGALWGLAFTWNAYRPRYSPAVVGFMSFMAGWLTIELALHHIAWQALAVALWSQTAALDSGVGWVALALCVVNWAALLGLTLRAVPTARLVRGALDEAMPAQTDSDDGPQSPLGWGQIAWPIPVRRPREVVVDKDVVFTRQGGLNLKLDVYRHRSKPTGAPCLLLVHGGGWVIGSKNQQCLPMAHLMATRGWTCVNANYRLSPHATYPEHIVDVKLAIRWIREHADELGVDPEFLVIAGLSAGAHLASVVALTPNEPALQPGFEDVDTRVDGLVSVYGVYDLHDREGHWPHPSFAELMEHHVIKGRPDEAADRWMFASPWDLVGDHAPPAILLQGDTDAMVPVAQARRFAERMRQHSRAPVIYAELRGAQHAFDVFPSIRCNMADRELGVFCERLWAQHRRRKGLPMHRPVFDGPAPAVEAAAPPSPEG